MFCLEEHIKDIINKYGLNTKKLIIAVSGGPDSVALLNLLKKQGLDLHVAHLNHGLRDAESDKDAEFVKNIAESLGLPYTIEKREVPEKGSLQQQAREVRYNFFKDVAKDKQTNIVVLAQHKDDQLETVLMNFFRGAGLRGLTGIKEFSSFDELDLFRPLLAYTKEEILQYLKDNNLKYRTDSSNTKEKYSRNKFRLKVIPFLEKELGQGFKNAVINNTKVYKVEEEFFIQEAHRILSVTDKTIDYPGYELVLDTKLANYHQALIGWVLRVAISKSKVYNLRELSSKHYQLIIDAILTNKATTLQLPNGINFVRWDNNLGFYSSKDSQHLDIVLNIELNKPIKFLNNTILLTDQYMGKPAHIINLDNAVLPLSIRKRKSGDTIQLSSNGGTKKIKDIFIDTKVAKHSRDQIPLLVDAKDAIIAILGYRVNGHYYIGEETKEKYYIYIH